MPEWQDMSNAGGSNFVLNGENFYISFIEKANELGSFFDSDTKGPETALHYREHWSILNGDFRAEYELLVPLGLEACKKFYEEKKAEFGSSWSTPSE